MDYFHDWQEKTNDIQGFEKIALLKL
jgi:hypothetical protein